MISRFLVSAAKWVAVSFTRMWKSGEVQVAGE